MLQLKTLFLFSIFFTLVTPKTTWSQNWMQGRQGRVISFEPPPAKPIPPGWSEEDWDTEREGLRGKLQQDKLEFEIIAFKQLTKIKHYFEYLSDPGSKYGRKKVATERRLLHMFRRLDDDGTIPYKGLYLDENLNPKSRVDSLSNYIAFMKNFANLDTMMLRVCWSMSSDTIDLQFSGVSEKVGLINNRVPKNSKFSGSKAKDFYHIYKGIGYIREEVTFFKDNVSYNYPLCKELNFHLRYLEVESADSTAAYEWIVYIDEIRSSKKQSCGSIKPTLCPPPKAPPNVVYESVKPSTYLVPGLGWDNFKKKEKKAKWPAITIATAGAVGTGLFYKFRSNHFYNLHNTATTFRELDANYTFANNNNKRFIVLTGSGLVIWAASSALIWRKDLRQQRLFREKFQADMQISPKVSFLPNGRPVPSISFMTKF